jgi:putative chitinase
MNIQLLTGLIPNKVLIELPEIMDKFDINTVTRLSHFLAQTSHESGGFKQVFENLGYRAETLFRLWPHRFRDSMEAEFYVGRPEQLANKIYGRRMGNGSAHTGDGFKYRGRGYIQLTGRHNYTAFDAVVPENIVENPDLVATKYPLLTAGWFWKVRSVNQYCFSVADSNIMRVTKIINGGSTGLEHRKQLTLKIHALLETS